MLNLAAVVAASVQLLSSAASTPLVEERQKVVLRAALFVAVLWARPRGRGRGQVSGTVQERQEIIRVHVVQLKTKKNQSINNRLQINQ